MEDNKEDATILVVEDEQIVAFDIMDTLKTLGYSVLGPVDTGSEALKIVEKQSPDLVLLDVKIKGSMDGIETAEELREKYQVPFIFLSTFSDSATLSRAKKTEPLGFITKSSHKNDLHSTLEMALYKHRMELKVQKHEELLSVTLKSMSDAAIGASLDGTIMSWNRGAVLIFGYTEEEILGENLSILTPPFYPNEIPEIIDKIGNNIEVEHYETLRQNKKGEIIHVSIKVSPIRDPLDKITGISIIARDITVRKRLERQVLEISEKERMRIGKDLHDSLGQNLTGIELQLKLFENMMNERGDTEAAKAISGITEMVNQSIIQTRNLAKNLLTVTLQNQGLSVALKELASYAESIFNTKTYCKTELAEDINDEVTAAQLYHIAQEAVTNANRHSSGDLVQIRLTENESEYILKIQDNGNGMIRRDTEGLGLRIMDFRSHMINGRLSIFGSEESGSTVTCRVPKLHYAVQE
ncbi:MAG: PAS domain S-box protein [Spirochaetia bacterium]